jgi:flagellar hook assembly protein FlgD
VDNFPNPFNPHTTVSYTVPSNGPVTLTIFDARGAMVKKLVDGVAHTSGAHQMTWDGLGNDGAKLASGLYFARVEHGGLIRTKKMLLLR